MCQSGKHCDSITLSNVTYHNNAHCHTLQHCKIVTYCDSAYIITHCGNILWHCNNTSSHTTLLQYIVTYCIVTHQSVSHICDNAIDQCHNVWQCHQSISQYAMSSMDITMYDNAINQCHRVWQLHTHCFESDVTHYDTEQCHTLQWSEAASHTVTACHVTVL